MKGFIARTVAVRPAVAAGLGLVGCCGYATSWIPATPTLQYAWHARKSASAFTPQIQNGHVLDQTVWNWHFETDEKDPNIGPTLNAAGMENLNYLVRRRRAPTRRSTWRPPRSSRPTTSGASGELCRRTAASWTRTARSPSRSTWTAQTAAAVVERSMSSVHDPAEPYLPADTPAA